MQLLSPQSPHSLITHAGEASPSQAGVLRRCRCLVASAAILCGVPDAAAQSRATIELGIRGPTADVIRASPQVGVQITPVRWRWGALAVEASWSPRRTLSDSGAFLPAGQPCLDPHGNTTTCASVRNTNGEAVTQLGASIHVGGVPRRTGVLGQLALGLYAARTHTGRDIWDPTGLHLSNLSYQDSPPLRQTGLYARVGLGVQHRLGPRGRLLAAAARYRWAKLGDLLDLEYPDYRHGVEVVMGVGIF